MHTTEATSPPFTVCLMPRAHFLNAQQRRQESGRRLRPSIDDSKPVGLLRCLLTVSQKQIKRRDGVKKSEEKDALCYTQQSTCKLSCGVVVSTSFTFLFSRFGFECGAGGRLLFVTAVIVAAFSCLCSVSSIFNVWR